MNVNPTRWTRLVGRWLFGLLCSAFLFANAFAKSTLAPNEPLYAGEHLESPNGKYHLWMQSDGNLVLYRVTDWAAIWSTNTWRYPGSFAIMQGDGNLVVYSGGWRARWASNTPWYAGASLALQDDGNLVIYTSWGQAVFASNTVHPLPTPRRFQMSLFSYASGGASDDLSDISMVGGPGPFVQVVGYTGLSSLANISNWSNIVAVFVDEPYWAAGGAEIWTNPCYDGSGRYPAITQAKTDLQNAASLVQQLSNHKTRFWVNFSEPEMQWMMDPNCPMPLNDPLFDVVSFDKYNRPFYTGEDFIYWGQESPSLWPYVDYLVNNRASESQQLALVPGTLYQLSPQYIPPTTEASWLQAFFDFANASNEQCNLPLGQTGVTGYYDGCLVWMVTGFWDQNTPTPINPSTVWTGVTDPNSWQIRATWASEVCNKSGKCGH